MRGIVPKGNNLWILGSWQDLGLLVLSPLWVIPLLWMAKSRFDPNGFGAMILAISGTGHHLPGFIRAYTDPALFRRFRARFIAAPLFLLGVYVLFSGLHLESLKLILILWGTWHGAMQVNGFLRIYDAKAGSIAPATSWLDWAMCIVWFGGGLLYSSRLITIFSFFFKTGGGLIPPEAFVVFRQAWMVLVSATTLAFLINAWNQTRAHRGPSPVKLLLMVSSFSFWWFAMISVSEVLVGLLLFEIVHDIQYNALVWHYNRRRVSAGVSASSVEKFLFQPNASRALLYVVLILSYGAIADILGYVNVQAPSALQVGVSAASFWTGLFMVSTFPHFYFDGFIWQVREKSFQREMGIERSGITSGQTSSSPGRTGWLPAGLKWAFFVVPVALLGVSEYRSTEVPLLDQARNVVNLLPDRWQASAVVGSLEHASGDQSRAIEYLERAVALNPSYSHGETMLGDIYYQREEPEVALRHYARAADLNPEDYKVQGRLGALLVNEGRSADAIPHLLRAAEHEQTDAELAYILGATLVQKQRALEGIPYLRRAVRLDPQRKEAFNFLGIALQTQGDIRAAADYYRKALTLDPQYPKARENLERVQKLLLRGE